MMMAQEYKHLVERLPFYTIDPEEGVRHLSDCARHNPPAYPAGCCDCGADILQGAVETLSDAFDPLEDSTAQMLLELAKAIWAIPFIVELGERQ